MRKKNNLIMAASAPIPTEFGTFDMHIFHWINDEGMSNSKFGLSKDHVVLTMGNLRGKKDVITRIHSECLTSEVFGSTKCDCQKQLVSAQRKIAKKGEGIIIYLRQEGRGIGLVNKIKAYKLQSKGFNTLNANRHLNLPDDLREYDVAAEIIKYFKINSIKLLTNNPLKLESLKSQGIHSIREKSLCKITTHSELYLSIKRDEMGHMLPKNLKIHA